MKPKVVMFTFEQLASDFPRLIMAVPPALEIIEFNQDDFRVPASEESIIVYRGMKHAFDSEELFWQRWSGKSSGHYQDSIPK